MRSSTVNSVDGGAGGGDDGLQAAAAIEAATQVRSSRRVRNPAPVHGALDDIIAAAPERAIAGPRGANALL
ncbi:MAG: hypothetical protein ACRETU_05000 [Steroidobacterales bacterium]